MKNKLQNIIAAIKSNPHNFTELNNQARTVFNIILSK